MDRLMELDRPGERRPRFRPGPGRPGRVCPPAGGADAGARPQGVTQPAALRRWPLDNPVPVPPFHRHPGRTGHPPGRDRRYFNETSLFRNQWGYRPAAGETDAEFKARVRAVLRERLAAARQADVLRPAVAYGYFAANSDGDDLVIWSDDKPLGRAYPLQLPPPGRKPLAVHRRLLPARGLGRDRLRRLPRRHHGGGGLRGDGPAVRSDRYGDYLHLHGLSVEMAEALAEYWHWRIRDEWGFAAEDGPSLKGLFRQQYRGGRYSWGYPACPDLEDNARCAELVGADRIGVECGEETSWQFHPEQTTAAIICHHPQAKYFIVRRAAAARAS